MSATLAIEIDPGPLERTRADVAVVFFFDSDRPLRGGAGRADWRLCGRISQLILADRLGGAAGEAALIPSGGGLAAPLLLVLGLGARNTFDAEACEALGWHGVDRARRLGARSVALPLPDPHAGDLELGERIEALVAGGVRALADVSAELRLYLVPPPSELAAAQRILKEVAARPRPAPVELRLPAPPRLHPSVAPPGAARSGAESPQTIK